MELTYQVFPYYNNKQQHFNVVHSIELKLKYRMAWFLLGNEAGRFRLQLAHSLLNLRHGRQHSRVRQRRLELWVLHLKHEPNTNKELKAIMP